MTRASSKARGADMERDLTAYLNSSAEVELRFGLIPERLRGMVVSEVERLKYMSCPRAPSRLAWSKIRS